MINFISFLGWNPGTEKEIYSIESLISDFTIEKVQKSGAVFNIKKLENINSFYIKELSPQKITELALPFLINSDLIRKEGEKYISADNEELSLDYITSVVVLHQKRMKTLSEISEFADLFFKEIIVDKDLLTWKDMIDKRLKELLDKTRDLLSKIDNSVWNEKEIENVIMPFAEETGDRGEVLWPLRAALTGKKASAGPFEVAAILGKKKSLTRVEKAISII
jgi:nondiscriminating glutamyl-tRNA synthetase